MAHNHQICFNPLPSPKQGETLAGVDRRASRHCFNTLPSPKQGDDGFRRPLSICYRVSIQLPSPKQGETLVAITSGITKTYTGTCAIRSNSCQECPTRLPRNAITCCYAGSFQLRESKGKTPSLHFRARYKTSGSFKSTGSPTPVMLRFVSRVFVQMIKPERILLWIKFL